MFCTMRIISGYGGLKVRGTVDPGACHCPRWFGLFLRKPRNPPSQNLMRPRCSQRQQLSNPTVVILEPADPFESSRSTLSTPGGKQLPWLQNPERSQDRTSRCSPTTHISTYAVRYGKAMDPQAQCFNPRPGIPRCTAIARGGFGITDAP